MKLSYLSQRTKKDVSGRISSTINAHFQKHTHTDVDKNEDYIHYTLLLSHEYRRDPHTNM